MGPRSGDRKPWIPLGLPRGAVAAKLPEGVVYQEVECGRPHSERAKRRIELLLQAAGHKPFTGPKTPTPPLPFGEGAFVFRGRRGDSVPPLDKYRAPAFAGMTRAASGDEAV